MLPSHHSQRVLDQFEAYKLNLADDLARQVVVCSRVVMIVVVTTTYTCGGGDWFEDDGDVWKSCVNQNQNQAWR